MNGMGKSGAISGRIALLCVLAVPVVAPVGAEEQFVTGTPAIRYALSKLNVLGSVLMIGAHPDDENNAVLTYVSRGLKAKTGYLSLNRGEGGQNLLGPEQGVLLGALRTQELLAARRDDGGSQYFTRAIDFGFTTSLNETVTDWGHDKILSDIVWVIRQTEPDVVILCFSGTPTDGHGNHQAAGVLGKEAYEAAGDPSRFPEQLKWVKPWHARRLLRSRFTPAPPPPGDQPTANVAAPAANPAAPAANSATSTAPAAAGAGRGGPGRGANQAAGDPARQGPGRAADPFPNQPTFTVQTGDFDPVFGRSYREIASISRSEHRSQAQGATLPYGAGENVLAFVEGEQPQKSVLDGIDVSWKRVSGSGRVGEILAKAASDLDDQHPDRTVPALLEARKIVADLARDGQQWAIWKLEDLDEAIALCAGIHVEAAADAAAYVPGATAKINMIALNRSPLPVTLLREHLSGWGDADSPAKNKPLENNKLESSPVTLKVPANQPFSQPFWLREPHDAFTYTISDQTLIGRADTLPEVTAKFDFSINGTPFSLTRSIHYRYADPGHGRSHPARRCTAAGRHRPSGGKHGSPVGSGPRRQSYFARSLTANQSGDVRFEVPQGWKVQPASAQFSLKEAGAVQEVRFRVMPPAAAQAGQFKATAKVGSTEVATGMTVIPYSHVPAQTILLPSDGKLAAVAVKTLARRVGYVMGSTDEEPESLRQMGLQVDLLDEKDLKSGNLAQYDAIITGLRAYSVRADLRSNQQRMLDYVKAGGTLIVQYNRNTDRRMSPSVSESLDHLGPYPFTFGDNDARVTDEDAPVKFLAPDSPLLNTPNKITQADFEGWVQERGMYFATKWDAQYQTVLESHDMGDKDQPGGILYTRLGKGAYIFTGYAWNRQLPAGVPGAYRIMANLISAGKAGAGKTAAAKTEAH